MPDGDLINANEAVEKRLQFEKILGWLDTHLLPEVTDRYPEIAEQADSLRGDLGTIFQHAERLLESADGAKKWAEKVVILAGGAASVIELMEELSSINKLAGPVKKGVATTSVMRLYELLDTGLDGGLDRLKLPWLPSGTSNTIERWVLQFACDWGVEIGVAVWNKFAKKGN
jgi:hypothetical protein